MAEVRYFVCCDLCRQATEIGTVSAVPTTWANIHRVGFSLHVCCPCRVAILEDGIGRGVVIRNTVDDDTK